MNGWPTVLAFWQEATPAGNQTGSAWRPPGVVNVSWSPVVATTFDVIDPLSAASVSETVHQYWRINIRREPKASAFENFWLNAITDATNTLTSLGGGRFVETRELIDNVAMKTFGLEFILEDGNQHRFIGLAVARLEWVVESGRVALEEVELIGLQAPTFTGSVRTALNLRLPMIGSLQCAHYFRVGTTWTSGTADFLPDKVIALSMQLIWTRNVDAGQFNAAGLATRHTVQGGWSFVGRTRVIVPTMWESLFAAQSCKAAFRVGEGDNRVEIEALVKAKLSGHALIAPGQIEHQIDYAAIRAGRIHFTTRKYR